MLEPRTPRALGRIPVGPSPSASFIVTDSESQPRDGAQVEPLAGQLLVRDDLIFRLYDPLDEDGTAENPLTGEVLTVAADAELGSPALAAALSQSDRAALLEALAFDMVLLPVIRTEQGWQVAAFESGAERADLQLFSSANSFANVVGAGPLRHFVVRHGAVVADFARRRADQLRDLVFDPGSPHELTLPVALIAEILADVQDDASPELAWDVPEGQARVVDFRPALTKHWAVLDLTDEVRRDGQIRELVKRQTRKLSDSGASLRQDMRVWLRRTTAQAASAGGRSFAFLISDLPDAAVALSLVTYWHDLGPGAGHLDELERSLLTEAHEGDEIVRLRVEGDQVIRHARLRSGAEEVGGSAVPLLLIDYWLSVPGSDDLAHVAFSTPHLQARDALTALSDTIVLNGDYLTEG